MDASEKMIRTLILMIFLIVSACTLEMMPHPDPTPVQAQRAPTSEVDPTTPMSQPLPPYGATVIPTNPVCVNRPTSAPKIAYPQLIEMDPARPAPGDTIRITGSGGYLFWDDECQKGYIESARNFYLFLDGIQTGTIQCYVNLCEVRWTVPVDTQPGFHTLVVEGGSQLQFEVMGKR
jgi:hypothetical protein